VGQDGKLYFAGTSAGGNSIFRHMPRDLAINAANVSYDAYTNPYNTASNHIAYHARFDPANGNVRAGQFLLTRLSSTKGNTIEPRAITADEAGRVYIGGLVASAIANRTALSINGQTLPDYSGGDAWLMITNPDLSKRELWISFTKGGKGTTQGIAVGNGVAAIAGKATAFPMFTAQALQAADPPANTTAGYFAVWAAMR
jgi:hypothetical protein